MPEAGPPEQQAEQLFAELTQADPDELANQLRLIQMRLNRARVEMDLFQLATAKALLQSAPTACCSLTATASSMAVPVQRPVCCGRSRMSWPPARLSPHRPRISKLFLRGRFETLAACCGSAVLGGRQVGRFRDRGRRDQPDGRQRGRRAVRAGPLPRGASISSIIGATRPQKALDVPTLRLRYRDRALAFLARAIERGLPNARRLNDDAFLAPLRQDPTFRQLTERSGAHDLLG